jgi:hypothetical protein
MKKIVLFIGFTIAFLVKMAAQTYTFTNGARASALGGSGVTLTGAQAIFNNSAGLTELTSPNVIAAVQNSFLLSELKTAALGAILPTNYGVFALKFDSQGFSTYNEQLYTFIYARKLASNISLSTDIGYFRLNVSGYDTKNALALRMGCLVQVLKDLRVGCQVENPFSSVTKNAFLLPFKWSFGASYMASTSVMITTAIEKQLNNSIYTKIGIEYLLNQKLTARLGLQAGNSGAFTCGIGYNFSKNTVFNASFMQHSRLGGTSAAEVNWAFDKKN